ncbi:hypothetical protein HELRODRAFT_170769 [Helobdella robusta]|uniref:Huntingtin n=1 Tax=Helobdella robusta TaxID=6412 RepID=T1F3E5_HELRO|nr:hypothetical protein HELRODRAFT_170769 [Helobdella robusta]ESO07434.1 hypothetical protein HELRODRAFT_170769 [Helobdella robusta]
MAEKLLKAFENMKMFNVADDDSLSFPSFPPKLGSKLKDVAPLTKKEKIQNSNVITDCLTSTHLRTNPDFSKFLSASIELMLSLSDDEESDVRIVADECLNKIIKSLTETHISRIQVELYKEIKKNGASRSLKAALIKFGNLCHHIRSQKCRPYLVNILPCLSRISQRSDESIQECLLSFMHNISSILIPYATELEIKMLMKMFLANVVNSSPCTRRTAGQSLVLICLNSNFSRSSVIWLFQQLINDLSKDSPDKISLTGWLLAARHLLSYPISNLNASDRHNSVHDYNSSLSTKQALLIDKLLAQVLELILKYCKHEDHNVVNASLECLLQFLKHIPSSVRQALVSQNGFQLLSHATDLSENKEPNAAATVINVDVKETFEMPFNSVDELLETQTDLTVSASINDDQSEVAVEDCDDALNELAAATTTNKSISDSSLSGIAQEINLDFSSVLPLNYSAGVRVSSNLTLNQQDNEDCDVSKKLKRVNENNDDVDDTGTLYDTTQPPILHLARFLCKEFLLSGKKSTLMDDFQVRVSVKVISISCLTFIVEIHPYVLDEKLKRNYVDGDVQFMHDVLLYKRHADPHIRGNVALLVGMFISSLILNSNLDHNAHRHHHFEGNLQLKMLLQVLIEIFNSESSVASKCSLEALQSCLPLLVSSCYGEDALEIIQHIFQVNSNSYWLVKIELLNLMAVLDYKDILHHQKMLPSFNSKLVIYDQVLDMIMTMLGDDDSRVRDVATSAICQIIMKHFHNMENSHLDLIMSQAYQCRPDHLLFDENTDSSLSRVIRMISKHMLHSTSKQLTAGCSNALLKLTHQFPVDKFMNSWMVLFTNSSAASFKQFPNIRLKNLGHIPSLNTANVTAAGKTSSTTAPAAATKLKATNESMSAAAGQVINECDWCTTSVGGLLPFIISNITSSSSLAHDMNFHSDAIRLGGNIFIGLARRRSLERAKINSECMWMILNDRHLAQLAEQFFVHLMKMMNIFSLVILNCAIPTSTTSTTPSTTSATTIKSHSSLSSSLSMPSTGTTMPSSSSSAAATATSMVSPIKRKMKLIKDEPMSNTQDKSSSVNKDLLSLKEVLGAFQHLQHYQQLYNVLKISHASYKISGDFTSDKFCLMLQSTLQVLSQMLDMCSYREVGRCAEEMLSYLASTFSIDPVNTLISTQQLLKSLFGTNLISSVGALDQPTVSRGMEVLTESSTSPTKTTKRQQENKSDIFRICFIDHLKWHKQNFSKLATTMNESPDKLLHSFRNVEHVQHVPATNKLLQKYDKTSIATFIKLFEPLVIRALKQYTISSAVTLQIQVLQLLVSLIKLRVNYYLLDSDQIFIGFVMKQFEQIESGQINQKESHILLSEIMNFLVQLSGEKYHSKPVITIPKIIQLCDGIMASGLNPVKFCIPSLHYVTKSLFALKYENLSSNCSTGSSVSCGSCSSDIERWSVSIMSSSQEVETQREVVISMLLRVLSHCEALELFILVLKHTQVESIEKWNKTSRQLADVFFYLFKNDKICIENISDIKILEALLLNMSSCVYRPANTLVNLLFSSHSVNTISDLNKWLMKSLFAFKALTSYLSETYIEAKSHDMNLSWTTNFEEMTSSSSSSSSCLYSNEELLLPRLLVDAILTSMLHVQRTVEQQKFQLHRQQKHHLPSSHQYTLTQNVTNNLAAHLRYEQHLQHELQQKSFEVLYYLTTDLLTYVVYSINAGILEWTSEQMNHLMKSTEYVPIVDEINENIILLTRLQPAISTKWFHLILSLKLVDFEQQSQLSFGPPLLNYLFESESEFLPSCKQFRQKQQQKHLKQKHHIKPQQYVSCNQIFVQQAVFCLLSNYSMSNSDEKLIVWLLERNIDRLIALYNNCQSVYQFVRHVHANERLSRLLCDLTLAHYRSNRRMHSQPHKIRDMLSCLSRVHISAVGHVTIKLITTMLPHICLNVSYLIEKMVSSYINIMLTTDSIQCNKLISEKEVDELIKCLANYSSKCNLDELVVKLKEHMKSGVKMDKASSSLGFGAVSELRNCIIDKDMMFEIIKKKCEIGACRVDDCAVLLASLSYSSIKFIMASENFNPEVLKSCFDLVAIQWNLTISRTISSSLSDFSKLAIKSLHDKIKVVLDRLPTPHQLLFINDPTHDKYTSDVLLLFKEPQFNRSVNVLSRVLQSYLNILPDASEVDDNVCRLVVLSFELLHFHLIKNDDDEDSDGDNDEDDDEAGDLRWSEVVRLLNLLNVLLANDNFKKFFYSANNKNNKNSNNIEDGDNNENKSFALSVIYHTYYILQFKIFNLGYKNTQALYQVYRKIHLLDNDAQLKYACEMMNDMTAHIYGNLSDNHKFLLMLNQSNVPSYVHLSSSMPTFIRSPFRRLLINLSRLPLVNSYVRTPQPVWRMGWNPTCSHPNATSHPPVPFSYLREKQVLIEYICRVNSIGWTSRQQFEETWMSFLGVLNPSLYNEEENSTEDCHENVHYQILAMRSITCLLLLTSHTPYPGNPSIGRFLHMPRNQLTSFLKSNIGLKLLSIRHLLEYDLKNYRSHLHLQQEMFGKSSSTNGAKFLKTCGLLPYSKNVECVAALGISSGSCAENFYMPGQLSVSWMISTQQQRDTDNITIAIDALSSKTTSKTTSSAVQVVHSTDNFISNVAAISTDNTAPIASVATSPTTVKISEKCAKLTATDNDSKDDERYIMIRECFEDFYSFSRCDCYLIDEPLDVNSCLQLLLDLYGTFISSHSSNTSSSISKVHLNLLLETVRSLLLLSDVFVSASQYELMLMSMIDIYKSHPQEDELLLSYVVLAICKVQRVIESCLKSTHLPTKIFTLYGGLYLFESSCPENASLLLPVYVDYLVKSLGNFSPSIIYSQEHVMVMLSLGFLIMEKYFHIIRDSEFNVTFTKLCFNMVSIYEDAIPLPLYEAVMTGLERLLVCGSASSTHHIIDHQALTKLAIERFSQQNTKRSLIAFNVLISCIYRELESTSNDDGDEANLMEAAGGDRKVQLMERATIIFDRVRKGLPFEANIVLHVLPNILFDFFEPHEILNKIIGEFLYSQHSHAQLFAQLLFKVFDHMLQKNQSSLIVNWVMLSLSNFMQITPLSAAVWSLTCIFMSSSQECPIRPFILIRFPLVLRRFGQLDTFDLQAFCSSGVSFYNQLTKLKSNDMDGSVDCSFVSIIQSLAQDKLPYKLLLESIMQ